MSTNRGNNSCRTIDDGTINSYLIMWLSSRFHNITLSYPRIVFDSIIFIECWWIVIIENLPLVTFFSSEAGDSLVSSRLYLYSCYGSNNSQRLCLNISRHTILYVERWTHPITLREQLSYHSKMLTNLPSTGRNPDISESNILHSRSSSVSCKHHVCRPEMYVSNRCFADALKALDL